MNRPPSPRKPSWKDAAGARADTSRVPEWKHKPGEETAKSARPWWQGRRARLFGVLGGLTAVAVALFWVIISFRSPKPMRLVLIGAGYETNLAVPPNALGQQGLDALAKWGQERASEKQAIHRVDVVRPRLDSDDAIEEALSDKSLLGSRLNTIVVVVSAYGLTCDEQGQPALSLARPDHLRGEAKPYPVDNLLAALGKLPEKTRKLLLLDVSPVEAHWDLGQFTPSFVHAFAEHVKSSKVANLVVISSAGPNERSWGSPDWGTTIFAHFVREGLQGAADRDNSGRVDALELYQYLLEKVEHWVWHNRARVQRPLLLAGTKKEAETMQILGYDRYEPTPLPPTAPPSAQVEQGLAGQWKRAQQLRDAVPSPAVYTPQLWREYLDTLLHAEQVLRAGQSAGDWHDKLDKLALAIAQGRTLPGESSGLTLSMPQAFGVGMPAVPEALRRKLVKLLPAPGEEKKTPEELQKQAEELATDVAKIKDPSEQRLVRLQLMRLALDRIAADPRRHLAGGRQVLLQLGERQAPWRPVEAHYAVMLLQPSSARSAPVAPLLDAPGGWDRLKKSLEVRLLAEQAALGLGQSGKGENWPAYSEAVLPWVRQEIETADEKMRRAEDLLVTSLPEQWQEADGLLEAAAKGYRDTQFVARAVRRALYHRDRMQAELPYYTRWLAGNPAPADDDVLIALWRDVHSLDVLDQPQADKSVTLQAGELEKVCTRIDKAFRGLEDKLREVALKEIKETQNSWHEVEGVLQVPFLAPDVRLPLIRASRQIAAALNAGTDKETTVSTELAAKLEKDAALAAQRQARLALTVLGDPGKDWPDYKGTLDDIERASPQGWHQSLRRAGEQYGRMLIQQARQAQKRTAQAAVADLDGAADDLRPAARQARQVPGCLVGEPYLSADPVGALRRLRLHDLLCWQAARARLDFWAADQEGSEVAYFRAAGRKFLRDAQSLVINPAVKRRPGEKDPRLARVEAERALLEAAQPPVLESSQGDPKNFTTKPVQLFPTDEKEMWLLYRLRAVGLPPGQPVRWIDHGKGMVPYKEFLPGQRPLRADEVMRVALIPDRSHLVQRQHTMVCYFRGHQSAVKTTLFVQREPDLMFTETAPKQAGRMAVYTGPDIYDYYAAERTAISLVLDCSGSMNEKGKDGLTRWQKATRALRAVVKQLPSGVRVSLRAFGAVQFENHPAYKDIELVWESHRWNSDPKAVDRRMKEIERLTPHGGTPLVRTVIQALGDFPKDFEGLTTTMVVLTDGADSNFYYNDLDVDLKQARSDTISQVLSRAFGIYDIQLHVIGFEMTPAEKKLRGYTDFIKAIKDLKGTYYDAKDPVKLSQYLRLSLLQMYYRIDADNGEAIRDSTAHGHSISRVDQRNDLRENLRWVPLSMGDYRASLPSLRALKQSVEIKAGDSLLLELVKARGKLGLGFRRSLYANLYAASNRGYATLAPPVAGWHMAALQNEQLRGEEKLQIMATLEKEAEKASAPNQILKVVRPRWSWFRVPAPDGKGPPPPLRVFSLADYPAPAWSLNLPWKLDSEAPSELEGWLIETGSLPVAGSLVKPAFQNLEDLTGRRWPTEHSEYDVTIESIQQERCSIETRPGTVEDRADCLVVRLRFPANKEPFFAQLPEWESAQKSPQLQQHRFYTRVGKYTGVFWPVTASDVKRLRELNLISVAECKKQGLTIPKLSLGKPNETNRPMP